MSDEPQKAAKAAESISKEMILESPLSVVKLDLEQLQAFTSRVNDFLNDPSVAAIRVCECCIAIS